MQADDSSIQSEDSTGSKIEIEHHRSIKPSETPTPTKKTPLPPALVLTLRVAATLAVLAVPAIFLQNSERRKESIIAAVVTVECVSSGGGRG